MSRTLARLTGALLAGLCMLASVTLAHAQEAPGLVPVQGRLFDVDEQPVDGTILAELRLYADAAGQMQVWNEVRNVDVVQGYFTLYLGEQTPLDLAIFRDYPTVYLGMAFDGDEEMDLIEVAAVPYAGYATFCGDAGTLGGLSADEIDTLANLGCSADQLAVFDGTNWVCAAQPATLTEAEVEAIVADNGYVTAAELAPVATSGAFGDLSAVPADLADGDSDQLANLPCADGQVAKRVSGTWTCAPDDSAVYTGSGPVSVSGTTISLVPNSISGTWLQSGAVSDTHIASGANIAPSKINGTAATLTGDQHFDAGTLSIDAAANEVGIGTTTPEATLDVRGDLQVDGAIRLRTPRTGSVSVPGTAFVQSDPGDDDKLEINEFGGYLHMDSGVSTYGADAVAPVQLPAGATITRMACYRYDADANNNLSSTVDLRRRDATSTTATTVASTSLSTSAVSSTTVDTVEDTTISSPLVDAAAFYWLDLYWYTADSIGTSMRFYGCTIDYTISEL